MAKVSLDTVLEIARKYYLWSHPLIESAITDEFRKVVTWEPSFDGKTKDTCLAAKLSYDDAVMGVTGIPNATLALACVVFDLAPMEIWSAQNLGCAIAMFCDNNDDTGIRSKESEIYADAETVLRYAIGLSMVGGRHSEDGYGPLVCLGNLQLDVGQENEANESFQAANASGGGPAVTDPKRPDRYGNTNGFDSYMKNAGKNPTVLQRSMYELMEKTDVSEPPEDDDESAMERYMDELCGIEAVTYADLSDRLDPETAAKMRADAMTLGNSMKLTFPSVNILTQFTTINDENKVSIQCAIEAIDKDREQLLKYNERRRMDGLMDAADRMDGFGANANVGGMSLQNFIKSATANPYQFQNNNNISVGLDIGALMKGIQSYTDNAMKQAGDAMDRANQMMSMGGSLEGKMKSGEMSKKQLHGMMGDTAGQDPLTMMNMMDPFDYANSWDVMVQQENVRILQDKTSALLMYASTVLRKMGDALLQISETYERGTRELEFLEENEKEKAHNRYLEHEDFDRYLLELHGIHTSFYPQFNNLTRPAFGQATQATAMGYKKLEKYIPRMYQTIMKHIMCISDEKVRDDTEYRLKETIATFCITAGNHVISAYGIGNNLRNIKLCGCDEEMLKRTLERMNKQKEEESKAMAAKQKAARDSFKSGEIDENSSFYKNFIKKYEYTLNLGVINYRSNLHFSEKSTSIWTPWGSFDHSKYQNRLSGTSRVSADLSLALGKEGMFKGSADFGFSYTRDRNGKVHPRDMDLRAGLGVTAETWPLKGAAGVSASLLRGTKVYGSLEASAGYIDKMKESAMPEDWGGMIPVESPSLELWSGEYTVTNSN